MDNRDSTEPKDKQSEFEKFKDLRKVVNVPQGEADEQERECKKRAQGREKETHTPEA